MKLNSIIKTTALLTLVIFVIALASCAETASNAGGEDTTIDTTVSTEDVTVDSTETTAPEETTEEPKDTEPEDTIAKETEPARDKIEPITPWEDESEDPDEVITGKELETLVKSADEAWEWLRVYNTFLENDAEPFVYREAEYYPVADYKTVDELRDRLLECFSVSLVNKMVDDSFNSESPLFIVENGVLMGRHHTRITNVELQIVSNFYAYRVDERSAYFSRPIQVKKTNNGATTVARDEYKANMVFEYGKWVFDSYPDFEIK